MRDATDLATLIEDYLHHLRHERRSPTNTIATYGDRLAHYRKFVKEGGVRAFLAPSSAELSNYLEALWNRGLQPKSVSLSISVLREFYRWLVYDQHTAPEAIRHVTNLERPRDWEKVQLVLSREQMARLLEAPKKEDPEWRRSFAAFRDTAILEALYSSGCRVSELVGMRLDNLDLQERVVRVTVKGGAERDLFLGRYAAEAVLVYLHACRPRLVRDWPDSPWLFVSSRGGGRVGGRVGAGGRLKRQTVTWLVKKFAERAGLGEGVTPHTIRRSAATHMLQGGADLRAVQEFLGHASIGTTQVYLRLDPSQLKVTHARFHPHGANASVDAEEPEVAAAASRPDLPQQGA